MFRRIEDLEGGPGDPRDFNEWASNFRRMGKNVILPVLIALAVIVLVVSVGSALTH